MGRFTIDPDYRDEGCYGDEKAEREERSNDRHAELMIAIDDAYARDTCVACAACGSPFVGIAGEIEICSACAWLS